MRDRSVAGTVPSRPEDPGTALEKAREDLERTLDEIAADHAGEPLSDISDALEKAVARAGVVPRRADLSALARQICRGHTTSD
jgi:hypothetical protein